MKLKLLTITSLFLLNTAWIQAQTTTSVPASGNSGNYNSSFGDQAGNAGNNNSVFGYKAGDLVTGAGEYNSFFGANTGVFNTSGKDNVFVGYKSGYTNASGEKNVFIGRESGYANNGGSLNVFTGYESGHNNFDGIRNTFAGAQSGYSNTSGSYNVFSGYRSGYSNIGGSNNIFSGYYAGYLNNSGSYNIFSGWQSGHGNSSGNYNTYIGYRAGHSNSTGSYNVFIGRQAGCKETGSNRLYIDNSEYSSDNIPLIYGRFDSDQLGINTNDIPAGYTMAVRGKLVTDGLKIKGDFVTENGNVGIGVPAPINKLEVAGSISLGSGTTVNGNTTKLFLKNPAGKTWALSSGANMISENTFSIYNWTDNQAAPLFLMTNDGKIGIGTSAPTEKLEVVDGNIGVTRGSNEGPALALYNPNKTARGAIWRMYNMTGSYQDGLQFWNYPSSNWSDGKVHFVLSDNGNVGIGTAAPGYKLELYTPAPNNTDAYSGINLQSENYGYLVEGGLKQGAGGVLKFSLNTAGIKSEKLRIDSNGKVGIGTTTPDKELTVNGTIHSKEVIVDTNFTPDYVFQKYYTGSSALKSDYVMPTLAEVAEFTKANNHLPNIPSAKEMQQNGMSLGEMNNLLLQKVEELTLYAIEQQKKSEVQNKDIEELKALVNTLMTKRQ